MELKPSYQCNLCQQQKTCFLFNEFAVPFAICPECFTFLKENVVQEITARDRTCDLCDDQKDMVFLYFRGKGAAEGTFTVCEDCFRKLRRGIEQ